MVTSGGNTDHKKDLCGSDIKGSVTHMDLLSTTWMWWPAPDSPGDQPWCTWSLLPWEQMSGEGKVAKTDHHTSSAVHHSTAVTTMLYSKGGRLLCGCVTLLPCSPCWRRPCLDTKHQLWYCTAQAADKQLRKGKICKIKAPVETTVLSSSRI